jgi:hypothetical protein
MAMNENSAIPTRVLFPAQRILFGGLGIATIVLTLCTVGMAGPPSWYAGLSFGVGALVTFLVLAGHAVIGMLEELRSEQLQARRETPPAADGTAIVPANPVEAVDEAMAAPLKTHDIDGPIVLTGVPITIGTSGFSEIVLSSSAHAALYGSPMHAVTDFPVDLESKDAVATLKGLIRQGIPLSVPQLDEADHVVIQVRNPAGQPDTYATTILVGNAKYTIKMDVSGKHELAPAAPVPPSYGSIVVPKES